MKFACSTWMMPGDTFSEKIRNAKRYGFEGVEIRLFEEEATKERIEEIKKALVENDVKPVSLIMPGETYRKPLLSERDFEDKVELSKKALNAAALFGCPTIVCPEYGAQIPLPLFDHPRRPDKKTYELLMKFLRTVSEYAKTAGTCAMIEPINRYETRFFYTLEDGVGVIKESGADNIYLLADFYHMGMEEKNVEEAIREYGKRIIHVHLGDSNRMLPGQGHTDFKPGFKALEEIGYDRYMALECSTKGNPEIVFPTCIKFLKNCCSK